MNGGSMASSSLIEGCFETVTASGASSSARLLWLFQRVSTGGRVDGTEANVVLAVSEICTLKVVFTDDALLGRGYHS